jgi:hypothetical protein
MGQFIIILDVNPVILGSMGDQSSTEGIYHQISFPLPVPIDGPSEILSTKSLDNTLMRAETGNLELR